MQQLYVRDQLVRYNKWMNYIQDIAGHPHEAIIKRRVKMIEFFGKYGATATKQAFEISRSTVYVWQRKLHEGGGRLSSLAPGSRVPHTKRQRQIDFRVSAFILHYRQEHPGVGKSTIHPGLRAYCQREGLECPSESTVGRILTELRQQGNLPEIREELRIDARTGKLVAQKKKPRLRKLRRKGYYPKEPGDLVQMDSVFVFVEGIKRYLITAIDLQTGFGFAIAYPRLSSDATTDFLQRFLHIAPFAIRHFQTDNGSEFEDHFRTALQKQQIPRFHNYPRHPQANAHVERFNRTLREQFIRWHDHLIEDVPLFNQYLMQYLLWYNTEKPHQAKNKLPPLKYFIARFVNNRKLSNMLWTST
jgi:transposase InsO family protein